MKKWLKITGIISGAVVLCAALVNPVLGTRARSAPQDAAGYREVSLHMAHRDRPVALHIWYPAEPGPVGPVGQTALFYGFFAKDAPPVSQRVPVVVLSHGSGGNARALGWFASALAAKGMIVIAPNHPGTTSGDSDPFRTPMVWQRAQDMSAALDYLASQPFGLHPDMAHVAVAGFSLGGGAAMMLAGAKLSKPAFIAYCAEPGPKPDCDWMRGAGVDFNAIDAQAYQADWRDARVSAVVVIDPALSRAMTGPSLAGLRLPVSLINLGLPGEIGAMAVDGLAAKLPDATYAAIPGARHFSFLAECSRLGWLIVAAAGEDNICDNRGLRDRGEIHAAVLDRVVPFLQQTLFGQPVAH